MIFPRTLSTTTEEPAINIKARVEQQQRRSPDHTPQDCQAATRSYLTRRPHREILDIDTSPGIAGLRTRRVRLMKANWNYVRIKSLHLHIAFGATL